MSLAHRRDDERRSAEEASDVRADEVAETMDDLFGAVTVVSPGGVYTLASEQSPLLLVARNDLPVGITVRLQVDAPSGMTITDIGPTTLPPRGSRTLTVPTEANDSRKLVVQFSDHRRWTATGRADQRDGTVQRVRAGVGDTDSMRGCSAAVPRRPPAVASIPRPAGSS